MNFQSLQGLHPRRPHQGFALEWIVEGRLSTVVPRPSSVKGTPAPSVFTHFPQRWKFLTSKYLDILNNECLLLEMVWMHVWIFGLSRLRGTLWKEAVYHKIKITYNNITYKETSFLSLALLHKPLIWALNLCAPKIDKIMSNLF